MDQNILQAMLLQLKKIDESLDQSLQRMEIRDTEAIVLDIHMLFDDEKVVEQEDDVQATWSKQDEETANTIKMFDEMPQRAYNDLILMNKREEASDAYKVFDELPQRNLTSKSEVLYPNLSHNLKFPICSVISFLCDSQMVVILKGGMIEWPTGIGTSVGYYFEGVASRRIQMEVKKMVHDNLMLEYHGVRVMCFHGIWECYDTPELFKKMIFCLKGISIRSMLSIASFASREHNQGWVSKYDRVEYVAMLVDVRNINVKWGGGLEEFLLPYYGWTAEKCAACWKLFCFIGLSKEGTRWFINEMVVEHEGKQDCFGMKHMNLDGHKYHNLEDKIGSQGEGNREDQHTSNGEGILCLHEAFKTVMKVGLWKLRYPGIISYTVIVDIFTKGLDTRKNDLYGVIIVDIWSHKLLLNKHDLAMIIIVTTIKWNIETLLANGKFTRAPIFVKRGQKATDREDSREEEATTSKLVAAKTVEDMKCVVKPYRHKNHLWWLKHICFIMPPLFPWDPGVLLMWKQEETNSTNCLEELKNTSVAMGHKVHEKCWLELTGRLDRRSMIIEDNDLSKEGLLIHAKYWASNYRVWALFYLILFVLFDVRPSVNWPI